MKLTYHIPVFRLSACHPNNVFAIFEDHGLGKVLRIDVVPRNDTIPSLEWMRPGWDGAADSRGMLAFVHCEGTEDELSDTSIDQQALRAIDDPEIEFRIDWEHYLQGAGESYWIITRSTSQTPPTAACATYEREPFSGHMTVVLRSPPDSDTAPPVKIRCALYGCGISTGTGVCFPGNDDRSRYDLEHGEQCFLDPLSSVTGDICYDLNAFVAWYGHDEGNMRFASAPVAAPSAPMVLDPSVSGELKIGELHPDLAQALVYRIAHPLSCLQGEGGIAYSYVDHKDPSIVMIHVDVRPTFPPSNEHITYDLVVHREARARRMRGIVWAIHSILDEMCAPRIFRLSWRDQLLQLSESDLSIPVESP